MSNSATFSLSTTIPWLPNYPCWHLTKQQLRQKLTNTIFQTALTNRIAKPIERIKKNQANVYLQNECRPPLRSYLTRQQLRQKLTNIIFQTALTIRIAKPIERITENQANVYLQNECRPLQRNPELKNNENNPSAKGGKLGWCNTDLGA